MKCFLPSSALITCNDLGTVYLYSESEKDNSSFLNLSINYYILSDNKVGFNRNNFQFSIG